MRLWQTVAFPQRDRNFSISELKQSTAENADCSGKCESALSGPRDARVYSHLISVLLLHTTKVLLSTPCNTFTLRTTVMTTVNMMAFNCTLKTK